MKALFFVNSNENKIVRKMKNIYSIVELLSYGTEHSGKVGPMSLRWDPGPRTLGWDPKVGP